MFYENLLLEIDGPVAQVKFNRPGKANALDAVAWSELLAIFNTLNERDDVRVIVLSGEGKHFCSGIDLSLLMSVTTSSDPACAARTREKLRKKILELQAAVSAIETCSKPVLAAVSGGCIGAGLDIISACDMRYASDDAYFSIREIDMGMVADLGTLQRLPRIIPAGFVREMAFTGKNVGAQEAERTGLINKSYAHKEELMQVVLDIAKVIAAKSPLAVRGTKHVLNHSRDHSIADGLEYVANWNAGMLLSEDLHIAFQAKIENKNPVFKN